MGRVTEVPAPDSAAARAHFAARLAFETDPTDVYRDQKEGADDFVVLDARSEKAFIAAHIPGAIHLPPDAMDEATTAHFLPAGKTIVAYCWGPHCNAADKAAARLAELGYKVKVMIGGIEGWRKEEYALEGTDA